MLTFIPSRHERTIAAEVSGKLTEADAELLDEEVRRTYKEGEKFNLLIVIRELDGTSVQGVARGFKVDMKYWGQYNKIAFVSEKNWMEMAAQAGRFLPGLTMKHFRPDEVEAAWEWIRQ